MVDLENIIDRDMFADNIIGYNSKVGWIIESKGKSATISYVKAKNTIVHQTELGINESWSNEHEELHEEPSKNHFLDVYERQQVKKWLMPYIKENKNIICDLGASTGHMLNDLKSVNKNNILLGGDLFESGLIKSHKLNPSIFHIQLDACQLPFKKECFDVAISLNVLEHIENDVLAISEMYRILKQCGIVCIVVPFGRGEYDYYDEIMFHKRRYGRNELVDKLKGQGFTILNENYLAFTGWPLFALKKKYNRIFHTKDSIDKKMKLVRKNIASTKDSKVGHILMNIENSMIDKVKWPFGIRNIVLAQKK